MHRIKQNTILVLPPRKVEPNQKLYIINSDPKLRFPYLLFKFKSNTLNNYTTCHYSLFLSCNLKKI